VKQNSNGGKKVAIGCGSIFAFLVVMGGCAQLLGLADTPPPAPAAAVSKSPSKSPTSSPSPTASSTPTFDEHTRTMCAKSALAAAHRKIGNAVEADGAEIEARTASWFSKIPAVRKLGEGDYDQHPARIRSWCKVNMPGVKPPKVKKEQQPDYDVPDPDVPDTGSGGGDSDGGGWGGGGRRGRWGF
jgi:hypothetical protein